MFDIDHFKRVNDGYGHDAGDRVIAAVGARAKRSDAISGRLGGEEFCLLARCSLAPAVEIAERLRSAIGEARVEAGTEEIAVTCSFGVAQWQHGDTIDRLLRRADMALYEAKKTGRNRVVASEQESGAPDRAQWRSVVRAVRA